MRRLVSAPGAVAEERKVPTMSCSGCRVLRKRCSEACVLRPCLQWIDGAEAQGHATVFVAKFFGRSGLISSVSAVPDSRRPELFESLLFEACGRTVNPVTGAVGLLCTGNWHLCQAAVETVLSGGALRPLPLDDQPQPPGVSEGDPDLVLSSQIGSLSSQQRQRGQPSAKRRKAANEDSSEGGDLQLRPTASGAAEGRLGSPSEEGSVTTSAESAEPGTAAASLREQQQQRRQEEEPRLLNLFA